MCENKTMYEIKITDLIGEYYIQAKTQSRTKRWEAIHDIMLYENDFDLRTSISIIWKKKIVLKIHFLEKTLKIHLKKRLRKLIEYSNKIK